MELKKTQREMNDEFITKELIKDLLDNLSKEKNISIKNKIK